VLDVRRDARGVESCMLIPFIDELALIEEPVIGAIVPVWVDVPVLPELVPVAEPVMPPRAESGCVGAVLAGDVGEV
jgi:hypothetical protein